MSEAGDLAAVLVPLLRRLLPDLLAAGVLFLAIYHPRHRRPDHLFSCLVINLVTFLICYLTQRSNIQLGFALGLFAVFGILRYRTESLPIRDLTYLFAGIGLAIFNGMPGWTQNVTELIVVDALLVGFIALLELTGWAGRQQRSLLYDNLALLAPQRRAELFADLTRRTGLDVVDVRIDRLDLLRESAELTVYHRP